MKRQIAIIINRKSDYMKHLLMLLGILTLVFSLSACTFGVDSDSEENITVYTDRHYDTDRDLYDTFEEETGIKVNILSDDADRLINKLENEGEDTPADILVLADAGRLHRAKERDILQSVQSDTLNANIPENYKDVDSEWFGLTRRARVMVYHPDRVDESELSTYEALAGDEWEGRVVTRSSTNIYNQSLIASLIAINGEDETKSFIEGLVSNFARKPSGNDRDQAKAVMKGTGDVAILNTYYMGRMAYSSDEYERDVAETLEVYFPNQETTGTHVNVSGAGVAKHTDNQEGAVRFIEFLSSTQAQESYASANYEYPINPDVSAHELLQGWGTFTTQDLDLSELGVHSETAAIIMDESGWE
jgi:iron(III) transport system substrate-binding protein